MIKLFEEFSSVTLKEFITELKRLYPEVKVTGPIKLGKRTEYRFELDDDRFTLYDDAGIFLEMSRSDIVYDLDRLNTLEKALDHALKYHPKEANFDFSEKLHVGLDEGETDAYETPKFIIKPYPGDKGYELTRKRYKRFLWVTPKLGKNGVIDKGENPPITEAAFDDTVDTHDWDAQNPAEISGMGASSDFPGETVGYTRDTSADVPSKYILDPDDRKKMKLKIIKRFIEFIKGSDEE